MSGVAPESNPPTPPTNRALIACPSGPLVIPSVPPDAASSIRLSLVIPTYNESKNVGELVKQLTALLDPVVGDKYELIVVDDDSPDRTWEVAADLEFAGLPDVAHAGIED